MSTDHTTDVAPDTRMLEAEQRELARLQIYQSAREVRARSCKHGYRYDDCALCLKRPGECDYGSCQRDAAVHVRSELERRPVCRAHAVTLIMLGWKLAIS